MRLSLDGCVVLSLFLLAAIAAGQQQAGVCTKTVSLPLYEIDEWHTVGTEQAPYWTGTCTRDEINNLHGKSDNAIKVEHIVWLGTPRAETTRCGWMKFNTSPIPESAVIVAARIRYLVFYWEMSFNFRFTAVNTDPVSTGAPGLYAAIRDGAVCADLPMGRLWDTTELNSVGVQHIQNSLSRNWVAFGLWGYDWSHVLTERAWIIGWNNNPRADSPWLDVEYSTTAMSEPGVAEHWQRIAVPGIVRSVLALPSASSSAHYSLLCSDGRKVMELVAGANDVSRLAPGVYFVRAGLGVRKVVIQND
ncbi:MAG: hypothetical protein ABIK37_00190 [candidate division WOR-3 bacterium]